MGKVQRFVLISKRWSSLSTCCCWRRKEDLIRIVSIVTRGIWEDQRLYLFGTRWQSTSWSSKLERGIMGSFLKTNKSKPRCLEIDISFWLNHWISTRSFINRTLWSRLWSLDCRTMGFLQWSSQTRSRLG